MDARHDDGNVEKEPMTMDARSIDQTKLDSFLRRAVGDLSAGYGGVMVSVGNKLGLYKAMAGTGPIASHSDTYELFLEQGMVFAEKTALCSCLRRGRCRRRWSTRPRRTSRRGGHGRRLSKGWFHAVSSGGGITLQLDSRSAPLTSRPASQRSPLLAGFSELIDS
jgi:hypothetical protein